MNKDDAHAIRLLSCVLAPPSDFTLPPHPSSLDVLSHHWKQTAGLHQKLVQTFGIPKQLPNFDVDPDAEFFLDQVYRGKRELLWLPSGLELFTHLSKFFQAQELDIFSSPSLFPALRKLASSNAAWLTFRRQLHRSPEACEQSLVFESGIYPCITPEHQPSAVQIVSFIAANLILGNDANTAFSSPSSKNLRFLRSSTVLMDDLVRVSVAFLPGHGVYLDAYILDDAANLHTADLFILPTR